MTCINSLHQKSFSFMSVGWQRLCLPVEIVLGYDFVCLVHLCIISPAFLISLPTIWALYILRQGTFSLFPALVPELFISRIKKAVQSSVCHSNNCVPGAVISVVLMVYASSYCHGQVLKEATQRGGFDNRKLAWKIESWLLYFLIFWWQQGFGSNLNSSDS